MTLIELIRAQQTARHDAAMTALDDRARDIDLLDRLARSLRGRGWNAQPNVTTEQVGSTVRVELWLHLSATASELADVLEHLGRDEITASRIVHHERRTLRHYALRLRDCTVQLHAYIHAARVAA